MKALRIARRGLSMGLVYTALIAIPTQLTAQDQAVATDLSGSWVITLEGPGGESMEMTWEIEQSDDGMLTGVTASDMIGEAPIDGGWVEDDRFGFSVYVEAQGQSLDIVYEGSVVDDEIVGFLDAGGGMFQADFVGVRLDGVRLADVASDGDLR